MDARAALAIAAIVFVSPVASQQLAPRGSDTKSRPPATDMQRLIEAEQAAKRDAERQRQACEAAIADYQARCPIRGSNPFFQTEWCADYQDYIRSRCFPEGKR